MIQGQLHIVIAGPDTGGEGEVDIRCSLVEQDTSNRTSCPNGQLSIINALKRVAGFAVGDTVDNDGVFRMPILVQDRSGYQSSLSLSHGDLEDNGIVTQNRSTTVTLNLADAEPSDLQVTPYKVDLAAKIKAMTDLEVDIIKSVRAPGRLFNADGKTVYTSGAILQVSGDYVLLKEPVLGKISVANIVSGSEQVAIITPRSDATEYNYQSTVWVVSSCGEIQHFDIEIPECQQQAWWQENGFPGDLLGGGDLDVIEPPNYAEGSDQHFNWLVCGDRPAADQQTADYFETAPGSGVVCHPGVKLSELKKQANRCGDDDDEWIN